MKAQNTPRFTVVDGSVKITKGTAFGDVLTMSADVRRDRADSETASETAPDAITLTFFLDRAGGVSWNPTRRKARELWATFKATSQQIAGMERGQFDECIIVKPRSGGAKYRVVVVVVRVPFGKYELSGEFSAEVTLKEDGAIHDIDVTEAAFFEDKNPRNTLASSVDNKYYPGDTWLSSVSSVNNKMILEYLKPAFTRQLEKSVPLLRKQRLVYLEKEVVGAEQDVQIAWSTYKRCEQKSVDAKAALRDYKTKFFNLSPTS